MGKQTASDWKIAKSYWFSSFVAGLLVSVVPMIIVSIMGVALNAGKSTNLSTVIFDLIGLFGIWLGAMYAGKSVAKKYFIKNRENIVIKVLALNFGVSLVAVTGVLLFSMVPGVLDGLGSLTYTDLGIASVGTYVSLSLYLYSALKYIRVDN
jgi:uncharacterized membrane protein YuzA (DUF378 family)